MKDSNYTIHKCQCLDFLFKIQQCETATIENDDKKLDLTSDGDDEHNFKMVLKLETESEYSSNRNKRIGDFQFMFNFLQCFFVQD